MNFITFVIKKEDEENEENNLYSGELTCFTSEKFPNCIVIDFTDLYLQQCLFLIS